VLRFARNPCFWAKQSRLAAFLSSTRLPVFNLSKRGWFSSLVEAQPALAMSSSGVGPRLGLLGRGSGRTLVCTLPLSEVA
jgi:hypothetical protein